MDNKEIIPMNPWYKNFKGKIYKTENNISIYGNYTSIDENTITITRLPINIWTTNYKQFLESIEINKDSNSTKNIITKFKDNNSETDINFTLNFPNNKLELFIKNDTIENKLKLIKTFKLNNMQYMIEIIILKNIKVLKIF